MRRWMELAARLYPRRWRARYGEEFGALLEDVKPGWRALMDVTRGALIMQITEGTSYLKLGAVMALAGALVAGAVSYRVPGRYISAAVLRMTPQHDPQRATDQLVQIQQETLSRSSLVTVMQRPEFDLYKDERRRMPMEDVIQRMREDIQLRWLGSSPPAFSISFAYPDRAKAQGVVRELATRLMETNRIRNRFRALAWREVWPQSDPPPAGVELELLEAANLPEKSVWPNRLVFVAAGLGAGLALGLLTASAMRRPKWTLRIAGFAAAGGVLAVALSFRFDTYTSTAVMRVALPMAPERLMGAIYSAPAPERVRQMTQEILSRRSLAEIIQKPSLGLYPRERAGKPVEEIVEKMRRNLRIQVLGGGNTPAFSISFTNPDRWKAQAAVREIVSRFVEKNITIERARCKEARAGDPICTILEHKMGENLEVLDPASIPEAPAGPSRVTFGACGVAAGLLLGAAGRRVRLAGGS